MMMMSILMNIVFAMALNSMVQASINCRKLGTNFRESVFYLFLLLNLRSFSQMSQIGVSANDSDQLASESRD